MSTVGSFPLQLPNGWPVPDDQVGELETGESEGSVTAANGEEDGEEDGGEIRCRHPPRRGM